MVEDFLRNFEYFHFTFSFFLKSTLFRIFSEKVENLMSSYNETD